VACILRLASRATEVVCWRCRVKELIGTPALWQPQVRPAPANPTARL